VLTEAIREFLAKRPGPTPGREPPFELEQIATAALMVECARIDGSFVEEERAAICRAVRREFALDRQTADCLVAVAMMREDEVWADWLFTETVRRHFGRDEQLAMIRRMWEVALADGTVHPFEERLIARIARELGISEEAVAQCREQARERIDGGEAEPRG
jgi:uncharacterized tellurite resistance protein B-like protein